VYTGFVASSLKNITFTAPNETIERARLRAREQHTTLNEAFRAWLDHYSGRRPSAEDFDRMIERLRHVDAGRTFTRDEMNERASHR
jgi:hypothetical protein